MQQNSYPQNYNANKPAIFDNPLILDPPATLRIKMIPQCLGKKINFKINHFISEHVWTDACVYQ